MRNWHHKTVIIIFILAYNTLHSQNKSVLVYVKKATNHKLLKNVKVTLEGYQMPNIIANYEKSKKCFYFDSIPKKYRYILACYKKLETNGIDLLNFEDPEDKNREKEISEIKKVTINLNYKNNWFIVDTIYKTTYTSKDNSYYQNGVLHKSSVSHDTIIVEDVEKKIIVPDKYKIFITLKTLEDKALNYIQVKEKIEKIVSKYGLEYVELKPEIFFCSSPMGYFYKIDKSRSFLDNYTYKEDFLSKKDKLDMYRNHPVNYAICFRKKDFSEFRVFNDPILEKIKNEQESLEFDKLSYLKFNLYSKKQDEDIRYKDDEEDVSKSYFSRYYLPDKKLTYNRLTKYDDKIMRYVLFQNNPKNLSENLYMWPRDNSSRFAMIKTSDGKTIIDGVTEVSPDLNFYLTPLGVFTTLLTEGKESFKYNNDFGIQLRDINYRTINEFYRLKDFYILTTY